MVVPSNITWKALPTVNSFVNLQLLNGGSFTASTSIVHAGVEDKKFRMYNWAFYVNHPTSDRHLLWDVGMTSVGTHVRFGLTPRLRTCQRSEHGRLQCFYLQICLGWNQSGGTIKIDRTAAVGKERYRG